MESLLLFCRALSSPTMWGYPGALYPETQAESVNDNGSREQGGSVCSLISRTCHYLFVTTYL